MKFKIPYKVALVVLLASLNTAYGQERDENIGTQVVNVVKPYTPTISDAFKVKETPNLDDDQTAQKETIRYNIFSFPVASTFAPAKGRAAGVDKASSETLYKNYLSLGIGSYANANAELFIVQDVGDNGYFGGSLRHKSTQGGVKNLALEDKFMTNALDLTYGSKSDMLSFTVDAGYEHQIYNWYGIDQQHFGIDDAFYGAIDSQQTYQNAYVGSKLSFNDSFFKEATVKYNRFWDAYGSQENRFIAKPKFDFEIADTNIKLNLIADYVGGSFEKQYLGTLNADYGYANFGVNPSFNIVRNDWSINLGATGFYSFDIENDKSSIFFYPQVNASVHVVRDLMIFYTGAEGSLQQNSYRDFSNENPFVSPFLAVAPTDRQFDIFAGLKGKLANAVSYNVKGSYARERDKALFVTNPYPNTTQPIYAGYEYGNSFGVVYDNMQIINFFGELKADFSKAVTFGVNADYSKFTVDNQAEAWNLPELKIGSSLDVTITEQWYAGADVFFTGERKDFLDMSLIGGFSRVVDLDSYFDANAHVGYKHNDRLSGFLKFNNIANQNYEKWNQYKVQGFQVMLGANYKFDF